jgi:hypothetical protein
MPMLATNDLLWFVLPNQREETHAKYAPGVIFYSTLTFLQNKILWFPVWLPKSFSFIFTCFCILYRIRGTKHIPISTFFLSCVPKDN